MENPKFSIITVCYNEKNVEKTCQSIVNQTWQDFEWIVIDGGSDKWCLDIFDKYKEHMTHFVSEKDNGIYNAMNKGIKLAKGKYLNFMNAGDCFYDNQVLEKVVENEAFENFDIIYGNIRINDNQINKYPEKIPYDWFVEYCLPHQGAFIKKELFEKYGLYNEKYRILADFEKWILFINVRKCTYKYIDQLIAIYDANGISSVINETHISERNSIIKKYYSARTIKNFYNKTLSTEKFYLFNICLLKIEKKAKEINIYLLGFIPFLMIKNKK